MKPTALGPPPLAKLAWRHRAYLIALLAGVALFHFLTMPRFYYPGDNMAIKAETAHLVTTGRVGFDYSEAEQIEELNEYRGQYFYANDAKHTYFSKYGFLYSLQYLPPLWLMNAITHDLQVFDEGPQLIFITNCYTILWALFYMAYLYKTFLLFNPSRRQAVLFVFLAVYPSYVWYYLRSPDKEVFQMVSFAGAVYHQLRYLQSSKEGKPAWPQLVLALFWGGYTYLFKPLYALLVFTISLSTCRELYLGHKRRPESDPLGQKSWFPSLLTLGGMLTLILTLSFLHNYLRTGSIFVAGYGQDSHDPVMFVFTAEHFLKGLGTYFLFPGNGNWFLHHPVFLVALFGYAAFFKKYRSEALFLATVVLLHLLVLCFHIEWIGEWCYGPRFCLHLLMMSTIPAAVAMAKFFATIKERRCSWRPLLAGFLFTGVVLLSLRAQLYIHTWNYFTYFYYSAAFEPLKNEELNRYFTKMPHLACLNRDLTLSITEHKKFPLLLAVDRSDLPAPAKAAIYEYTNELIGTRYWNYLLLAEPE